MIELLVVLAVISILLLLVAPPIMRMMKRARVESAARSVQLVVSSARFQAIKMGRPVAVFFDTDSSGTVGYARVIPFLDVNANAAYDAGQPAPNTEEFPKLPQDPLPDQVAFWQPKQTPRDPTTSVTFPNDIVAFNGTGQAIDLATGAVLTNCGDATNGCAVYIGDAPGKAPLPTIAGKPATNSFRLSIDNPGTGKVSFRKFDWASGLYVDAPWKWTY